MRKLTIALISFALTASSAQAVQLPSQVDLKAAYCISVKQSQIAPFNEFSGIPNLTDDLKQMATASAEKLNSDLRHLQRYLLPRLEYLDSSAIEAAMQQAKEDLPLASLDSNACLFLCSRDGKQGVGCLTNCSEKSGVLTRIKTCNDLSFLPF